MNRRAFLSSLLALPAALVALAPAALARLRVGGPIVPEEFACRYAWSAACPKLIWYGDFRDVNIRRFDAKDVVRVFKVPVREIDAAS